MNKEIIPVSPIYDRTPYYSASYFIRRQQSKAKKKKPSLLRSVSLICALNMLLCSLVYCTQGIDIGEELYSFVINNVYGGIVSEPPADISSPPSYKPDADSVPTAAEPSKLENSNDDNATSNDALAAYLKLYEFDYSAVPEGLYPIIPYDLSSEADGELRLYNDTSLDVDINDYAKAEACFDGATDSDGPIVLIIHTHGTEAYSEEGILGYSDSYNIPRSYDVTKNVIHIGSVITKALNENGISTVHCDVMHDAESYLGAYSRSAETIRAYLQRYPTIRYVFDIHRDSVLLEDKTKTRPVTIANGEVAAQIMTVAGSNELGTYYPNWESNLRLAAKLQAELNASNLGLARAVCLRGSSYNQELAPCSLLFEVGSCGNTIKEAEVSALILANKLAELIISGW